MHREGLKSLRGKKLPYLPPSVFAELGAGEIVYLKDVEVDGEHACAIFSANGQKLGMASDRDVAFGSALRLNLTPVSIN